MYILLNYFLIRLDIFYLFVSCTGSQNQYNVEASEANDWNCQQSAKGHQNDRTEVRTSEDVPTAEQSEAEGKSEHANHVETEEGQEQEEVAVVAPTNAIVDPGTVVVETVDTPGETSKVIGKELKQERRKKLG